MEYTKEYIADKIQNCDAWLNRAIIAIYKFQTVNEQETETTNLNNGHGFTAADAPFMSGLAKWLLGGKYRKLSDKQKFVARKRMAKYAGQLLRIAKGQNGGTNPVVNTKGAE